MVRLIEGGSRPPEGTIPEARETHIHKPTFTMNPKIIAEIQREILVPTSAHALSFNEGVATALKAIENALVKTEDRVIISAKNRMSFQSQKDMSTVVRVMLSEKIARHLMENGLISVREIPSEQSGDTRYEATIFSCL